MHRRLILSPYHGRVRWKNWQRLSPNHGYDLLLIDVWWEGRPIIHSRGCKILTRESLVTRICEALNMSGVDVANYLGHSFRSGTATTALQAGISDAAIQMLGRWRSDAYKRYIKIPADQLAAFFERLAHQ